ncbi:hypothetical protein PWEIH_16058 [Listeria weihenstephanensis FSL R9-0317]|nr:hypothetical protein PWEIH_16058 [Listeria weihenstephanensis FSL R9-0317]
MFYSSQETQELKRIEEKEWRYRVLDVSIATLALIISAPVLLLIMLIIKLSDIKAPVFFQAESYWKRSKAVLHVQISVDGCGCGETKSKPFSAK